MTENEYDVAIIGTGPGGYVAAIRAAQLGLKVVCIEKRETQGGTCLNVGCIPSKALLQSSEEVAFLEHEAKEHGIEVSSLKINFSKMQKRKNEIVSGLVKGVENLLKGNKVAIIHGTAQFSSPTELTVDGKAVKAKNYILATGSEPIPLPFLPIDEKKVLTSTGALALKEVPKKMIVIGAGVIGVELASVYNRLGTDVTVIEMLDKVCPAMDSAISRALQNSLTRQGLVFHLGAQVMSGEVTESGVTLEVKTEDTTQSLDADVVLVAIGRRPYSEGLNLEAAGIDKTDKGFILVDENFRTTQPHIYAIGDIIEGVMLAHRASDEGVVIAELIAGKKTHINYLAIPNVIYTDPEAASVGLTEEEAKSAKIQVKTGSYPFKGNARARCTGETDGLVKVVADAKTGYLLGMHILGANASEMIHEGVVAIEKKATLTELAQASHAHPTLSEAVKEAVLMALGGAIHA